MSMDLILRNTEEVVKEEELLRLLQEKEKPRAYVGYEPSGSIHFGHVLTVNKLIDLQRSGFEIVVLLADIHAYLNEKGDFDEIKEIADYNRRCFLALGLDENTKFVLGSDFQLEEDYMLGVLKLARETTLNRARRSMDEVSRSVENPRVSQMIYPLMQAMDIAVLGIDVAVGGIDQRKIHMLARENLPKLGFRAPICIHIPILLGLDGEKMSSSKQNYISVEDSPEEVRKKIRGAFCPAKVIDGNPVIQMFQHHIFPRFNEVVIKREEKYGGDIFYHRFEELEEDFLSGNLHPADLKNSAGEYLNKIIDPVRKELSKLSTNDRLC
ncbi:MAG: tyrosine--tRNA ligase [Candidatus Syntropharchaeia archaeon]